jgi:hypothetical protein
LDQRHLPKEAGKVPIYEQETQHRDWCATTDPWVVATGGWRMSILKECMGIFLATGLYSSTLDAVFSFAGAT